MSGFHQWDQYQFDFPIENGRKENNESKSIVEKDFSYASLLGSDYSPRACPLTSTQLNSYEKNVPRKSSPPRAVNTRYNQHACLTPIAHKENQGTIASFEKLQEDENISQIPRDIGRPSPPSRRRPAQFFHSTALASKKRLCFDSENKDDSEAKKCKSYVGVDHLDIIAMLEPYALLENILELLSAQDLYTMTLVSQRWRSVVHNSRKSIKRLHCFCFERTRSKENPATVAPCERVAQKHPLKRFSTISNFYNTHHQENNKVAPANRSVSLSDQEQSDFLEHQKFVKTLHKNESLIKCPRCGKGSKIQRLLSEDSGFSSFDKTNSVENEDLSFSRSTNTSQKLFKPCPAVLQKNKDPKQNMFQTFFSSSGQDETLSYCERPSLLEEGETKPSDAYGECSGLTCKFTFCLKCLCKYHPGEKCPLSELGTPSRINSSNKKKSRLTNIEKSKVMLKRKSLRRLCF